MKHLYLALQLLILLMLVPLQVACFLLHELHPRTLLAYAKRTCYYWAVKKKRAASGEPLWQQHDWDCLRIPNPDWLRARLACPPSDPDDEAA